MKVTLPNCLVGMPARKHGASYNPPAPIGLGATLARFPRLAPSAHNTVPKIDQPSLLREVSHADNGAADINHLD